MKRAGLILSAILALAVATVSAQTLSFVGPFQFCRVGQYTYFQIIAGRQPTTPPARGWQLLVSRDCVSVPWWIPGPAVGWPPTTPSKLYIYLLPDALFVHSLHDIQTVPKVFGQFRGVLDAKGEAAFEVKIPDVPALVGHRFFVQVVLVWIPYSIRGCPVQATNPLCVWIGP